MYRASLLAIIFLAATSTGTVAFLKLPELSYGEPVVPSASAPVPPRAGVYFTGDLMLARRVETLLDRHGSSFVYERMNALATSTNWMVTNFEAAAPRVHIHTPDLTFRFSVEERHLSALARFGVTHAALGNNHSYDTGANGFLETQTALQSVGIEPFGDQRVATSSVAIVPVVGGDVAIFSLYAVDTSPDLAQLKRLMDSFRDVEHQVAYIHWGSEYQENHLASTEALARELVGLGFDAIIGHHPHVVQDIGLIDGVPVFYSLGNFVFDQYFSQEVQEGLILRMSIETGNLAFELWPHTSLDARSQPRLLEGEEKALFLAELSRRSTPILADAIQAGRLTVGTTEVANLP